MALCPHRDEPKWRLDFLGRWKAKKYFIYSEGAIELDSYPLLHPEGRSKSGGSIPPSSMRSARIDALRYLNRGRKERLMEIRGKVIEQIV
jgi:hypothetical protein